MKKNAIKARMLAGETVYGMFVTCASPELVELCGIAGFDFAIIDIEHGAIDRRTFYTMALAAEARGLTPLARVPINMPVNLYLDWGAQGIVLPMIYSSSEAADCIKRLKFSPKGMRGSMLGRPADFGVHTDAVEYARQTQDETMVILQVETREAFVNIETILAENPLIDMVFIGPSDLAQAYGHPFGSMKQEMRTLTDQCVERVLASGKNVGIYVGSAEMARHYKEKGVRFIASDAMNFIGEKIAEYAVQIRSNQ